MEYRNALLLTDQTFERSVKQEHLWISFIKKYNKKSMLAKFNWGDKINLKEAILKREKKNPFLVKKLRKARHLYFDLAEVIFRFPNKEIFIIKEKNKKVKFFLPFKRDSIQRIIIINKTFYEIDMLRALEKYIGRNPVIIDIGSNIGNHVIYYGKILEAKKIYAFEPRNDVFNVLKKNIELNEFSSKVKAYNFGLGSKNCNASINYDGKLRNNLGSTSIKEDETGKLYIRRLDDIVIEDKNIDLIKIDVEGFEIEVLKGASLTIRKYKPVIWLESFGENCIIAEKILTNSGYVLKEKFHDANYIFTPI